MNPRVILTTSVISGLFGLYVVYALVMNTFIGVQTLETAKPPEVPAPEPPPDSQEMAELYLASSGSGAWELNARKRVRSGNAYLYFNEWAHRPYRTNDPDNAVEFNPFTMILKNDTKRPFTMQAETARIRFAKEFSFSQPEPGRPVEGILQGKVRITGPNGLVIDGRNFIYSEKAQKVYSDEFVRFRYGKHHGTAGRIRLDLAVDPGKIATEQFAVAGVDLITLFGHVELHLNPEPTQDVEALTVTCEGTLKFDTARNIATLRDGVHVLMPTESSMPNQKQYDSLQCDTLKLLFASENQNVANAETGSSEVELDSGFQQLSDKLTLTKIEADAASVQQPVIFESQKNALEARMTHFEYDRLTHVAKLADLNNQVVVIQRQAEMISPTIILEHDAEGEMKSVLCDRAGRLHYYDEESGELSLLAKWQRQMRVRPEDKAGLYLIELDHQTSVQRPQENIELSADHIKLWVTSGTPNSSGSAANVRDVAGMGHGQPENLLALGNVHMKHDMVNGHTDRLEVWFQEAPSVLQPVRRDLSGDPATNRAGAAATPGTTVVNVAHKQTAETEQSLFTGFNNTDTDSEPFDVWANLIQVLVYRAENPDESFVGGVVTTGDVTITQPKTDGSQPLRMQGNRIEVRNRDASNENQLVHVFGSPARITDAEVSLAGNLLNLDRAANRAWVTGPGVLMRPIDTSLKGEEFEQPELLKVWWKEKMEFNGRTAHFYDRVRTELGTSSVLCQEMKVTLNRRVDFQEDPRSVRREAESEKIVIERLECLYGVQVDSEEYKDGELTEVRQGEFGELVYDRSLDKSTIVGPGILYLWQKAEGRRIGLSSQNEAAANQPLRTRGSGWQFLQVDFNGNIDGNLDQQITHFAEGVEIVYGPVTHTGEKLNPHELPGGGGWIHSEELEVARHEETDRERAWLELRASGNVKLEGYDRERFRARADTVTFDQSKQMYRLRALGDSAATIWRQKTPGARASSAVAKVMEFVPAKDILKLDETTSLEGIQ